MFAPSSVQTESALLLLPGVVVLVTRIAPSDSVFPSSIANGTACLLPPRSRRSRRSCSFPEWWFWSLASRPLTPSSRRRSQTEQHVCSLLGPDGVGAPAPSRSGGFGHSHRAL